MRHLHLGNYRFFIVLQASILSSRLCENLYRDHIFILFLVVNIQ